jgi:hypothetical protein
MVLWCNNILPQHRQPHPHHHKRHPRHEAVVISTDEYERLKEIEERMKLAEHIEIYNILQKRRDTPLSEYVSMEDMAKKFDIDLSEI